MVGLNLELEADFFARHELEPRSLDRYCVLGDIAARQLGVRLVSRHAQLPSDCLEQELEMLCAELLEPLVKGVRAKSDGRAAPWFRKAEEFLHAHYHEPIGLRHVAREVGVHPIHLARVFRRHHGRSVSEHLQALRLLEAARLVLEGTSIAAAAQGAGFSDHAHLTRLFGRTFGFAPRILKSTAREMP